VELELTREQRASLPAGEEELVYGLRPEDLSLAQSGLPGTLSVIEPTGPETFFTVETALGLLTARVPGNLRRQPGEAVCLRWEAGRAHLFRGGTQERVG
jgi:multiple sugar transport system ATP-binding protein